MFSLPDLATLVTIAEVGSVRGASAVLNRTQPAVTQAIRRLEEAVGFPLLDRTSYRARLTEPGESFVKYARQIVAQARKLRALAELIATGVESRLRIEVDSAIPAERWAWLVAEIGDAFPDTIVELECGEGNATLRRLLRGDADLALLFDAVVSPRELGLEHVALGSIPFCHVVRVDRVHLLESDRAASFPQILVADFEDGAPEYGAIEGSHFWRVSNHRMLADAVRAGLGWGTAPEFMVERDIASGGLVRLSRFGLRERSLNPISLYRRRDVTAGRAAHSLWEKCSSSSP